MKYLKGSKDKNDIEDCVDILETALKSLMTKIQLANEGALRGQNITMEQINKNAMRSLRETEAGIQFWRDFVMTKSWIINTQKCSFYLKQYIIAYNNQMAVEE